MLSGLFSLFSRGGKTKPAETAALSLIALEDVVSSIDIPKSLEDRAQVCAWRWGQVDKILSGIPAIEKMPYQDIYPVRNAIRAVSNKIWITGEEGPYDIGRSTLAVITGGLPLIELAAKNYETESLAEHLRPGYRGNVITLTQLHRPVVLSGETLYFPAVPHPEYAGQLRSFIKGFETLTRTFEHSPATPKSQLAAPQRCF